MFIVTTLKSFITAPAEPHVARPGHIALRWSAVLGGGVGYKHLAAPRPDQLTVQHYVFSLGVERLDFG